MFCSNPKGYFIFGIKVAISPTWTGTLADSWLVSVGLVMRIQSETTWLQADFLKMTRVLGHLDKLLSHKLWRWWGNWTLYICMFIRNQEVLKQRSLVWMAWEKTTSWSRASPISIFYSLLTDKRKSRCLEYLYSVWLIISQNCHVEETT